MMIILGLVKKGGMLSVELDQWRKRVVQISVYSGIVFYLLSNKEALLSLKESSGWLQGSFGFLNWQRRQLVYCSSMAFFVLDPLVSVTDSRRRSGWCRKACC